MPTQPSKRKKRKLHESTEKSMCRVAFLGLAFMPLVLVILYGCISWTPWHRQYQRELWQHRISSNLGVEVQFQTIEFPSPNSFLARDFVCLHPETGKEILKSEQVQGFMDRSGWTVELKSPELNGGQLQSALQVVHDWFLCRPQKSASLLKLTLPELTVYDQTGKTKFENVDIGIKPTEDASTIIVRFSMEGQKFSEPSSLVVERNHALETPITKWEVRSNDVAIPCRFVASRFPLLHSLGPEATFRGKVAWAQNDVSWLACVQGDFDRVELGTLTSAIGSPLRGLSRISINQSEIVDSKLHSVSGSMQLMKSIDKSQVDKSWLYLTRVFLQIPAEEVLNDVTNTAIATVQELSFDFQLDSQGLSVLGRKDPGRKDWPKYAMSIDGKAVFGTSTKVPLETVSSWLAGTAFPSLYRERLAIILRDKLQLDLQGLVESSYARKLVSQYVDRVLPWSGLISNGSVNSPSNRVAGRP